MILVRTVFQVKSDKGDELVTLVKDVSEKFPMQYETRILTDTDGPFFTVVTETTFESLAAWEQEVVKAVALPEFGSWLARMMPLVRSASREFYNIEA